MGMYIPNMKPEQFYDLCDAHGLKIIAVPVPPHHGPLIDANGYVRVELMMKPGGKCSANLIAYTIVQAEEG